MEASPKLFEIDAPPKVPAHRSEGSLIIGEANAALASLPPGIARTAVTSPPYWGLRDYGIEGQIGAEQTVDDFVTNLVEVFRGVHRALADDGTLWLNIGDSYTSGGRTWRQTDSKLEARGMDYRPPTPEGLKPKDLVGVPWRLATALQADGWFIRSEIIWHKPNGLPESVKDRPSRSHEFLFLMSKEERYLYNHEAVKVPSADGKKMVALRDVWSINTKPFAGAHFATFPSELVTPCVLAGSNPGDVVLDPFFGSGTVGAVAAENGRDFIGIELNPEYAAIAEERLEPLCDGSLAISRA